MLPTTAPTHAAWAPPQWPQHHRSGAWLEDEQGRRYIAFFCAGGVFNLGFQVPDIAEEIGQMLRDHDMGLWSLPSERRDQAQREFARILPPSLTHTYFATCASETFEIACKLAKRMTGRPNLVSFTHGYHGHIGFSLAMDDFTFGPERFEPLAGQVRRAKYGDIDSLAEVVDERTAAVCIEPVQMPAGGVFASAEFLRAVRALCDTRGAMLITDEVQSGLLRTGRMWAIEHSGVEPDLLVLGKGLSAGYYPLGSVSMRADAWACLLAPPAVHRASFAGGEIGARVAAMVARRYSEPALAANVEARGFQLGRALQVFCERHALVLNGDTLRGRGLVWAVDIRAPFDAARVLDAFMACGVLAKGSAMNARSILFMPPLVINAAELDEGLARTDTALHRLRPR